jgi:hypothetical protein
MADECLLLPRDNRKRNTWTVDHMGDSFKFPCSAQVILQSAKKIYGWAVTASCHHKYYAANGCSKHISAFSRKRSVLNACEVKRTAVTN